MGIRHMVVHCSQNRKWPFNFVQIGWNFGYDFLIKNKSIWAQPQFFISRLLIGPFFQDILGYSESSKQEKDARVTYFT
jgi:hypothetical protein